MLLGVTISLASNLFTMFVIYELLTLTTIPLISHSGGTQINRNLYKYLKILLISSIVLFLPAVLIIYHTLHNGDFVNSGFIQGNFTKNHTIILFLMFIFGISKSAPYPLHNWLPNAMVANYPTSAILHAVLIVKTGIFCIIKIIIYVFGLKYLSSIFLEFDWIILMPIYSIFYSSFKALSSNNIKMILAYSTINQLAIILLSCFLFTKKAIFAALLHLISHSFSKICLFYSAGNFYSISKTTNVNHLLNMSKLMPYTSFIFLIASLSLIGLPPFGGFISKFYIMRAAIERDQILILFVIALSTVATAIYMTRILLYLYSSAPQIEPTYHKPPSRKIPLSMMFSLYICASGIICFFLIQINVNKFFLYV
jgi:multicomponent Na+:H+ antiporter subunit D